MLGTWILQFEVPAEKEDKTYRSMKSKIRFFTGMHLRESVILRLSWLDSTSYSFIRTWKARGDPCNI